MASLQRNSRSDEQSTARPSPWREEGVIPAPLELDLPRRAAPRLDLAERDGAAVAELPGPDAELMTAVPGGERLHRRCDEIPGKDVHGGPPPLRPGQPQELAHLLGPGEQV